MNATPIPHRNTRLSVAVIVRNDAQALEQTLQSVESIAGQFVVVDTGSQDETPATARSFGAKLVEFEWCDDFSAARNFAMEQVTGDWVLWLDAGETIGPDDVASLREFVESEPEATQAYMLIVQPPAAPGVIAGEQVARIRLIPNRPGIRFLGRVRESLYETLADLKIEVVGGSWRILRGSREHDPQYKQQRAKRNLYLAELEANATKRSSQLLNCMAEAELTLGNTKKAMDLYSESLETDHDASSERLEAFYGVLTCLDSNQESQQSQLALCVKALEQYPLDAQLLCAMGGYLQGQNRVELAIRSYQTAFEFGKVNPLIWHLQDITAIAAVCCSVALQMNNDDDAALQVLQDAIARDGHVPRICRALMDLHIKHGKADEALQQVDHLPATDRERELLSAAVQGACVAAQKNWPAAIDALEAAYEAGCRESLCFRWLAGVYLSMGDIQAATTWLRRWQKHDPADLEPARLLHALSAQQNAQPGAMPALKKQARPDVSKNLPASTAATPGNTASQV